MMRAADSPDRKPTRMLPPLPAHPDLVKLPLDRMKFEISGTFWQMDVVRDEAAQLGVTADRELYPFGLMIWESAVVLADVLDARGRDLAGRSVLELGCGVGMPGLVARQNGARVVQTDHDALALALCRHNAALNRIDGIEQFVGDWMAWTHPHRYDLVIGADIIYDTADYEKLEQVFRASVAPRGEVLLTDPMRQQTIALFTVMEDAGWTIDTTHRLQRTVTEAYKAKAEIEVQVVTARLPDRQN